MSANLVDCRLNSWRSKEECPTSFGVGNRETYDEIDGMITCSGKGMPFLVYLHTEEVEDLGVPVAIKVNHRQVEMNEIANDPQIERKILNEDAAHYQTHRKFQSKPIYLTPYIPVMNPKSAKLPYGSLAYFSYRKSLEEDGKYEQHDGVGVNIVDRGANAVSEDDMKVLAWLCKLPDEAIKYDKATHTFSWEAYLGVLAAPTYQGIGSSIQPLNKFLDHLGFNFQYKEDIDVAIANRDFKRIYQAFTAIRFAPYDGGHKAEFCNRIFNGHTFADHVPMLERNESRGGVMINSTLCYNMEFKITTPKNFQQFTMREIELFQTLSRDVQKNSTQSFKQPFIFFLRQWRSHSVSCIQS